MCSTVLSVDCLPFITVSLVGVVQTINRRSDYSQNHTIIQWIFQRIERLFKGVADGAAYVMSAAP